MPVHYLAPGNVLDDPADALVNTVNCEGFMGKGVALAFARDGRFKSPPRAKPRWGLEIDYKARCRSHAVRPGEPYVYEVPRTGELFQTTRTRFVINFPTKDRWRGPSRLDWIVSGLARLPELIVRHGIQSLAMPPIGAGLGGLDWDDVRSEIDSALAQVPIPIRVYEPSAQPDSSHGY